MTLVRLEPAALRSLVKHSTTQPLRSLTSTVKGLNEHYFYWMSLFSLGSRLPGEPCDLILLLIIVAQNYDAYFALPGVNTSVFKINR